MFRAIEFFLVIYLYPKYYLQQKNLPMLCCHEYCFRCSNYIKNQISSTFSILILRSEKNCMEENVARFFIIFLLLIVVYFILSLMYLKSLRSNLFIAEQHLLWTYSHFLCHLILTLMLNKLASEATLLNI